eukprot:425114_1
MKTVLRRTSFCSSKSNFNMAWAQIYVELPKHKRGFHWVTQYFTQIKEIKNFKIGQMHIFLQDNDASITLCESWDQSVTQDMETIFNRIVPDSLNQNANKNKNKQSNKEQKDNDNPQSNKPKNDSIVPRAKSILIGNDITIPITNGKLSMGTWQGIWLCEHIHNAPPRKLLVTINGIPL